MTESVQQRLEHSLTVLEVGSLNNWDDIEKQYRQLIQRWHPDRNSGEECELAQNKFIEINSAFKLLREHYRKNGSIPRPLPPEQQSPLLGTKTQKLPITALIKNKFAIGGVVGLTVLTLFAAVLWSLDSRLAENNRDRAKAEKIDSEAAEILRSDQATIDHALEPAIQQSETEVQP